MTVTVTVTGQPRRQSCSTVRRGADCYSRFFTTRSPGAAVWGPSRPFSLMGPDELADRSPLWVGSMASDIVACVVAVPTSRVWAVEEVVRRASKEQLELGC